MHTSERVNAQIEQETLRTIERCARQGVESIDERLRELDREWDMERTLQTNFAILTAAAIAYGAVFRNGLHRFGVVTGVFMLQHSLQGWCPPVPLFRRLGFRTNSEIDRERAALKALRGDFVERPRDAEEALRAVER